MSRGTGLIAVTLILLTLLSAAFLSRVVKGNHSTSAAPVKPPVDPYANAIAALEKELQRTDLSADTRKVEEGKLEMFRRMATQRANALLNPPTHPAYVAATPTMVIAEMKLPDGIDNRPSVPFSEKVVKVLNSWRKTTPERYYLIYAGYLAQDPKRGAVLVVHTDTHRLYHYLTPERSGGVRVVAEEGTRITLQADNGAIFYFDATKEQFVDAKGSLVPTAVTTPTATPTPPGLPEELPTRSVAYPEP